MRTIEVYDEDVGTRVAVEVDDELDKRIQQFSAFTARNPDIFGMGAGDRYNRRTVADAVEANNFSVSMLAFTEQKVYEKQYTPMKFEQLLGPCISYAAGEGATTVEYEVMDMVGQGKRISPQGGDMPYADVASVRIPIQVANGGVGYQFTTEDLRNAAFSGRPLPMKRMQAAMTAYRRHMNFVALQGEAQSGFTGLFNNAGVTTANRPSGAVWDAATADTMISDITFGLTAVRVATQDNDYPTIIGLPIASFERLQIPRSTASDTTVMEFMQRVHQGLKFVPVAELSTLGAGATRRMVFFNPTDENIVYHIPMPLRFLAPQYQDLAIKVPGEYKYGGLNVRRTPSMYYMDGI